MSITSPIDPSVDPDFDETAGEHLADPLEEYDQGQLPRQVLGPDELPDPASLPDHTLVYLLPPYSYVCTAPGSPHRECVGQVLRVAHHLTGTEWNTISSGVCQNVVHRTNLLLEVERQAGVNPTARDFDGGRSLYASRFPPVTVPPVVDVDTLTPLQRRIHDYLRDGGTRHLRDAAFRDMLAGGVFEEGRTDANVRALVETIVSANTSACEDGKRRFLDTMFPEPEPEPEPETRPFFPRQTTTYTLADLQARDVDDTTRFVAVPALINAVFEAKERHELCDAGVQEFFDEFGIDATRTVRYGVDFKGPDGDRHQILSFELTVPIGANPIDGWDDGDLDEVLNEAVNQYFADLDIDHRQVTWHKRFDTYRFEED